MSTRRTVLVAVAVVLLATPGAVRIADPLDGGPAPPDGTDGSPAAVAAAAIRWTEGGSYEYRVAYGDRPGNVTTVRTGAADGAARRVHDRSKRFFWGDGEQFETAQGEWRRPAGATGPFAWRGGYERWYGVRLYRVDALPGPSADVRVVSRNRSTVVLRVTDTDAAWALVESNVSITETPWGREHDVRATMTLTVDRETGRLRRSEYVGSYVDDGERDRFVRVVTYDDWGETSVARPTWVPYTFRGILVDVVDGSDGDG